MNISEKKDTGIIVLVTLLVVLVIGLTGYIAYDKISESKKNDDVVDEEINNKKTEYKSYNVGDKITVKLGKNLEENFYVLKNSNEDEEIITLFAEKNIGNSAFNNDYSKGNEYRGSLIENKLNELTNMWTNVKVKRLITVDEIKATGLIETVVEDRGASLGISNPVEYTYINKNSFLLEPGENDTNKMYWTMTKVSPSDLTDDTNNYVYLVGISGCIEAHIVGYKDNQNAFKNYGIRPVIEISKNYIK